MIKIPKDMIISKIKEKTGLTDAQLQTKVKDKLDQLSGLISEEGALHIIANELGVKILEDAGKLKIKNVLAGMRNVEITGKVVKIYEVREFNKNNRKGKVGNFLIGDSTGVMRVVAWNDKADLLDKLSEQDTIKIINGYARENRNRTEIHLGDKTKIEINPKGTEKIEVKPIGERKTIKDLSEDEQNVEIMGTIVQVFDPRFFTIDPDSGKRAVEKDGKFFVGTEEIPEVDYSYVTNVFLDDGTESIRVVLWKSQTQNLFDMSHEEILEKQSSGFEDIKNDLLGKIVKFRGRTNKNEMFDRVEFIASFVDINPNPDEEIKRVEKKLEQAPEPEEVSEEEQEEQLIKPQTAAFNQEKIQQEKVEKPAEKVEVKKVEVKETIEKISEPEETEEEVVPIDLDSDDDTEGDIEEIDDIEEITDIENL